MSKDVQIIIRGGEPPSVTLSAGAKRGLKSTMEVLETIALYVEYPMEQSDVWAPGTANAILAAGFADFLTRYAEEKQ